MEYAGPTGVIKEQLAEPPEATLLSTHSLPPDFQGVRFKADSSFPSFSKEKLVKLSFWMQFTREGSQQVLRVLDGYRWHLQALMAERVCV